MLSEAALLVALTVEHGAGTDDCLEAKALERAVERRLTRRVFVTGAQAGLRLRVSFVQVQQAYEAKIELSNPDGASRGTRVLSTSGHCSKLDDALALSVALLVDEPPEPEPATTPLPEPAPSPQLQPQPAVAKRIEIPAEVAAPREPWQVGLALAAKGAWGILPGLRPALSLQLVLTPPRFWSIRLQAEGYLATRAERDADSGARFQLWRAGLALCPALARSEGHRLGLCVGQQLGWVTVEGYGFDRNASERRLSYALTAGGEATLRLLGPVSARGYLGLELPLLRDRFASGGERPTDLFRQPPLGFSGEIGVEAALW